MGKVESMLEGGQRLGRILKETVAELSVGISTAAIDRQIEKKIFRAGGLPSFKRVPGYRWASCVGLNEEVVHSIPCRGKMIQAGDLVKLDVGMCWRGYHTDMALTLEVTPDRSPEKQTAFLAAGRKALELAVSQARAGNRLGHLSQAIQKQIESSGYTIVKALAGHGIGRQLHEEPLIPGFLSGDPAKTRLLKPGMTLAIEVIYTAGKGEVVVGADGWTISTKDGKMAGLFEKTVAVTQSTPLILTPF